MNIAKILKYCPKGTKLYSPVYGDVTLHSIDSVDKKFPILINDIKGYEYLLTEEGHYTEYPNSECVLFPSKDQRDWDEFRLPVKRGDIMMSDGRAFIISDEYANTTMGAYHKYICGIDAMGEFKVSQSNRRHWTNSFYIPASEEAKKELFDKMAEAGYRWNADTLELERTRPKFKEGDVVIDKMGDLSLLSKVEDDNFAKILAVLFTNGGLMIHGSKAVERDISMTTLASIKDRNRFFSALVKEGYKYDKEQHKLIKQEFKPFDKVLVRNNTDEKWSINLFSYYEEEDQAFPYVCVSGRYEHCIPYEGNEHLVGKKDDLHE